MDDATTKIIECPRCGSTEFSVACNMIESYDEYWCVCRNCDWTMGKLEKFKSINLVEHDEKGTVTKL